MKPPIHKVVPPRFAEWHLACGMALVVQADDSTGSPVRVYQRPRRWPRLLGRIGILAGILLLTAAVSWWVWTAFIRP